MDDRQKPALRAELMPDAHALGQGAHDENKKETPPDQLKLTMAYPCAASLPPSPFRRRSGKQQRVGGTL